MSYIIIYNPHSPNPVIDTNWNGFIETYASSDDAAEEADKNIDDESYRDYQIYEELTLK
jgi:hypothetical protein